MNLQALQKEANKLQRKFSSAIRREEEELADLKEQASLCQSFLNSLDTQTSDHPHAEARSARINWREVFDRLPNHFTAQDIQRISGCPLRGVYTRAFNWIAQGKIRRTDLGQYERLIDFN